MEVRRWRCRTCRWEGAFLLCPLENSVDFLMSEVQERRGCYSRIYDGGEEVIWVEGVCAVSRRGGAKGPYDGIWLVKDLRSRAPGKLVGPSTDNLNH